MKQRFLFVILIALILILPFHQAQAAGLGDVLTSWVKTLITGYIDLFSIPIAVILMVAQAVTGILPVIAAEIFKVTMALNDTIALTPASPNALPNDMVVVGFNFTRDLANMLFILILAWVGFATILRLETYEVKKIIPKLVIIALLINFIPVITGVILDIASILTKYFADKSLNIGALLWEKLPATQIARSGTDGLLQLIPGQGGISGIAVKSLMGIVFNIIAFLMLGLYAFIFIMRIVAIWVLIVLAPLAWLGYIIPQGKKMWDKWWKQFIQWAVIGIFLTFFLYLSGFVLGGSMDCNINEQSVTQQYGFGTGILSAIFGENLICNTLPFIAGIVVMLAGFILSISFAPTGADAIMKGAKKGGLVAGKVLGPQVWKVAKTAIKAEAKAPFRFARGFGQYMRGRRPDQITRGTEQPISPGLMMEEGMEVEAMRQRYRRPSGVSRIKGAVSAGLEEAGVRDFRGKTGAVRTEVWKTIKASAQAGWIAGIGGKQKKGKPSPKRGYITCPLCTTEMAADADRCPKCRTKISD